MFYNLSKKRSIQLLGHNTASVMVYGENCPLNAHIYQYYQNYPENNIISELMEKKDTLNLNEEHICQCYEKLLDYNQIDLIFDIIPNLNCLDGIALFLVAVDNQRYDIIDLMISYGFNLSQDITRTYYFSGTIYYDTLCYAISTNNLEIVKYLIERGAKPKANDVTLYLAHKYDMLDYLLEIFTCDDDLINLLCYFFKSPFKPCTKNTLNQILDKINNLELILEKKNLLLYLSIDRLKLLLQHGLKINYNNFKHFKYLHCLDKLEIIIFLLEEKIITPSLHDIINVINAIDPPNLSILITLAKYGYDLSLIPDVEEKYFDQINQLEQIGLKKETLLGYYIKAANRTL